MLHFRGDLPSFQVALRLRFSPPFFCPRVSWKRPDCPVPFLFFPFSLPNTSFLSSGLFGAGDLQFGILIRLPFFFHAHHVLFVSPDLGGFTFSLFLWTHGHFSLTYVCVSHVDSTFKTTVFLGLLCEKSVFRRPFSLQLLFLPSFASVSALFFSMVCPVYVCGGCLSTLLRYIGVELFSRLAPCPPRRKTLRSGAVTSHSSGFTRSHDGSVTLKQPPFFFASLCLSSN